VTLNRAGARGFAPQWFVGVIGCAAAIAALLAVLPVAGVIVSLACVAFVLRRWPGAVLALSWSGFWLYLGALDALDVTSRSAFTALAYAALALALTAFAWSRRATLAQRLRKLSRPARWWLAVASALGLWFLLIGATVSHGPLAHRLVALFVISTIPTLVAVAAATRSDVNQARGALVILGLVFLIIDVIVALQTGSGMLPPGVRFSPIDELDPINAALVPALGCVAAATYRAPTRSFFAGQLTSCALLAGAATVPHARGPLLALLVTVVTVALLSRQRKMVAVLAALGVGLVLGLVAAQALSTGLTVLGSPVGVTRQEPNTAGPHKPGPNNPTPSNPAPNNPAPNNPRPVGPVSSLNIRKQWLREAIGDTPDRPVFGHGIGMLVDRTPEAKILGVAGQRVYPHNDIVESAYSLGAIGFLLFIALLAIPVAVLIARRGPRPAPLYVFAIALFTFAFVESNFSGEIGTDVLLWSGAMIIVLGLVDTRAVD
jgi:hypothetical protein